MADDSTFHKLVWLGLSDSLCACLRACVWLLLSAKLALFNETDLHLFTSCRPFKKKQKNNLNNKQCPLFGDTARRVSQCPQLTDYKSTSQRWLTRRKTPFLSLYPPLPLAHSLSLTQHFSMTAPNTYMPSLLLFSSSLFPSVSSHSSSLLPHSHWMPLGCALGDYDNGDFVLGICVSLTC